MLQQNIPQLRFPEFSGAWTTDILDNFAKFSKGKNISKADITENGEIECIRYGELYTSYDVIINEIVSKTNLPKSDLVFSKTNDIIIPSSGETQLDIARAACVLKDDIALGGDLNIIRTPQDGIFLAYSLNEKKKFEIAAMAQGNSVVHLYSSQLKTLTINYPTLTEQQKIASFLSAADKKIEQLQQKKALLEQYKKGLMQKLFSQQVRFKDDSGKEFPEWEEKELGEVAYTTTGSSNREDSNLDGEYTFFDRSEDIRTSNIYLFDGEAIIVAGEGQQFKPKYFIGKFDLHQRTYAIMNFGSNSGKYIYYHIDFYRNYFYSQAVGSTVKSLRLPMFNKMPILLPCGKEQTKIADFLTAIDAKINTVRVQLDKAKQFKKGLLQQMFV